MKKVLAIIPARGGSKGIPRKSLLKLGGKSLIEHAIYGALKSKCVTRTIFSSDDKSMMQEASLCGAEVLFKRPYNLANDTASSWSVVCHAVDWLEENESWSPDIVVLLQPTTPFRKASHIDAVVNKVLKGSKSSCISVREVDYPPQWMFYIDDIGNPKKVLESDEMITRRQDAPTTWQPNGLVYAIERSKLQKSLSLPNQDTSLYKMSWEVSINIDNHWQYELAKVLFRRFKKEGFLYE